MSLIMNNIFKITFEYNMNIYMATADHEGKDK